MVHPARDAQLMPYIFVSFPLGKVRITIISLACGRVTLSGPVAGMTAGMSIFMAGY